MRFRSTLLGCCALVCALLALPAAASADPALPPGFQDEIAYRHLKLGAHTFSVKTTGAAAAKSKPARFSWTVLRNGRAG
jgi:hypothetical protein